MQMTLEQNVTVVMAYELIIELEDELRDLLNHAANSEGSKTDDYDLTYQLYDTIRSLRKKGMRS